MRYTLFGYIMLAITASLASQTVGLIEYNNPVDNGYTLIAPSASRTTFLIDNCGKLIHTWESDFNPGLACYLLPNGSILRTARIQSTFNSGGSGGRVERIGWDGQLEWAYNFSNSNFHQHHDIEPLPNGNFLVIAWEVISENELDSSGRQNVGGFGFWSCYIIEVEPIGVDSANFVWEWRAWDHIVQDVNQDLANYGVIAEHPEKIDVNLDPSNSSDWLHVNGIDYNPKLDQIVLSVHDVDEIWVIDHSTTTAQAATDSGGRYGMGGGLLYRWGNPQNYGRGNLAQRRLFGQHDVRWVDEDAPGGGGFSVYNNGSDRLGGPYSTVDIWQPPIDSFGFYQLENSEAFEPQNPDWTVGEGDVTFFSNRISGAQRLRNGNTLVCQGGGGRLLEVDSLGNLVWEYINPVGFDIASQGNDPVFNDVFKVTRYYGGDTIFDGVVLEAGEPIELNPLDYTCDQPSSVWTTESEDLEIKIYPNPVSDELLIELEEIGSWQVSLLNLQGKLVKRMLKSGRFLSMNVNDLIPGMYYLIIGCSDGSCSFASKIVVE